MVVTQQPKRKEESMFKKPRTILEMFILIVLYNALLLVINLTFNTDQFLLENRIWLIPYVGQGVLCGGLLGAFAAKRQANRDKENN